MSNAGRRIAGLVTLLGLFAVAASPRAASATILSGDVSFDAATGLYTYTYTVNNTSGPGPIDELSILVSSDMELYATDKGLPNSKTSPNGWDFGSYKCDPIYPPAASVLNEYGSCWMWSSGAAGPVDIGQVESSFSVTTACPPSTDTGNNYFLYSYTYSGGLQTFPGAAGSMVEWGHVVAPNLDSVPEPSTFALLGIGLVGLIAFALRKRAA
jgi:hypothetical protein